MLLNSILIFLCLAHVSSMGVVAMENVGSGSIKGQHVVMRIS